MSRIHYFNPGHETAILLGKRIYTPPAHVRAMQKELAILPAWYADAEDLVLVPDTFDPLFLSSQPGALGSFPLPVTNATCGERAFAPSGIQAMPWGISPQSIYFFETLRENAGIPISVPAWKEAYFHLTGRQTAAECLEKIRSLLPGLPVPAAPCFCGDMRELDAYMASNSGPFVVKTPYSSSGRGVLWITTNAPGVTEKNWIAGAFKKQGRVSIERGLDNRQDFAMEFHSDGLGNVRYEGLSVFNTEERGGYTGNLVESEPAMRARIARFTGEEGLQRIRAAVARVLSEVYGTLYTGYLGVDMLVYEQGDGTFAIHPCVEINMRYTMGMVALRLFRKYVAPDATGEFRVTFEKGEGVAYDKHLSTRETCPLRMEGGKVREGYLSLCPVTKETHYRAYLLIFP